MDFFGCVTNLQPFLFLLSVRMRISKGVCPTLEFCLVSGCHVRAVTCHKSQERSELSHCKDRSHTGKFPLLWCIKHTYLI